MSPVRIDAAHQRSSVTVEEERIFHYISDEELEMLPHAQNEPMQQIFWLALGAIIGSLQGAVLAIGQLGSVLSLADLVPLFVFVAGIVAASIAGPAWRAGRKRVASMQDRIRSRHKVPVTSIVPAVLDHPPA